MTKASLMAKLHDFVTEIMKQMEERELTKEEAEALPEILADRIKRNNERFEETKPFVVFKN
jgi:hypothetical protein